MVLINNKNLFGTLWSCLFEINTFFTYELFHERLTIYLNVLFKKHNKKPKEKQEKKGNEKEKRKENSLFDHNVVSFMNNITCVECAL